MDYKKLGTNILKGLGLAFITYLLSGSGSVSILMFILIIYLEYRLERPNNLPTLEDLKNLDKEKYEKA